MVVSVALSLMLALSGELVPPDGCAVVAAREDGSAVAACADGHTWFVFDRKLTRGGLWSLTHNAPPGLMLLPEQHREEEHPNRRVRLDEELLPALEHLAALHRAERGGALL